MNNKKNSNTINEVVKVQTEKLIEIQRASKTTWRTIKECGESNKLEVLLIG